MPSKTSSTRVTSYMKNLGKSFGYALGDVFKEYNPVVFNMGKEIKETSQDLYQGIKSFTMDQSTASTEKFGDVKGMVNATWQNALSDIKSGKWYNKERAEALEGDFAKAMGLDFDFDFDFDEDWGDDLDASDKAVMSAETESTKQVVGAMDVVGASVANSVNRATAESANYIVASSNRASKALYDLNVKGFSNVTNAVIAVNNTLGSIGKLGEPLTAHMQNSAMFFTNTSKKLDDIYQVLGKIAENTTKVPEAKNKSRKKRVGLDDLFSDDGLDFYQAKEMIKDSFKDYKELGDMALNAINSLKGNKNISVMQLATTTMTKALIPNMFKKAMEDFNKSLSDTLKAGFIAGRNRLHGRSSKSTGSIAELLLSMMVPDRGTRKSLDHGNYEKGAVAWDGKSRKALMEVIPDTLLAIYSAVSGAPMMTYDYDKGTYVTKKSIKANWEKTKNRYAVEAGGDFRAKSLAEAKATNDENVFHYVNLYFNKAFESGNNDFYDADIVKSNFKRLVGDIPKDDEDAAKKAVEIITKRLKEPAIKKQFMINNEAQIEKLQREMENVGNDNVNHIIDNGFKKGKKLGGVGKNGVANNPNDTSQKNKNDRKSAMEGFTGSLEDERKLFEDETSEVDKNTNRVKDEAKSWYSKVKSFFFKGKGGKSGLLELYEKPFIAVANFLGKLTDGIDKLFFDDKFKDSLVNKFKEKFSGFWEETKNYLSMAGGWFKNNVVETAAKGGNTVADWLFGQQNVMAWQMERGRRKAEQREQERQIREAVAAEERCRTAEETEMAELMSQSETSGGASGINNENGVLGNVIDLIRNGYNNSKDNVKSKMKENKIISDKMKAVTSDLFKEMGDSKGAMGAGAIIGAGASLFTGGLIGPLFGASLGAAAGLTLNSRTVQKVLFGEIDENGNVTEGILSEKQAQFIKKQLPDMAKGGTLGAAAGLFMGSPLIGAIVGSGIGFAKNSDTVKDFLFGKMKDGERQGGAISKELQNKIKQATPAAGIGAILGLLAGPFGGPIPNLLLGSALGMAATSETFKLKMFGGTDSEGNKYEGLINKLSNNLLKNVNGVFHNIYNSIKGWSAKFLTNTTRFAKEQIAKRAGNSFIGKAVKGVGNAVGNGILNLTGGAIDITGGVFKGVNSAWAKHNARKGYDVYDSTLGRNLTAKERGASRNSGKWQDYLTQLGDMNDTTQIQDLITELEGARFDSTKATEVMSRYGLKKGDIATALQNAKGQLKQADSKGPIDKQLSLTGKIESWVAKIYKKMNGEDDSRINTGYVAKPDKNGVMRYYSVDENGKMKQVKGTEATEDGKYEFKTEYDILGNPHQIRVKVDKSGNREEVPDNSDNETKKSEQEIGKFKKAIYGIPVIGSALEGLSGKLHDFIFGNKEEKKDGLFDKLSELFMGDGGFLHTILGWFGKTKVGKLGGKLLAKVAPFGSALKASLGPILGAALVGMGLTGKFDKAASKLGFGKGDGTGGNLYNYYDENGNKLDPSTATSEQLANATVRQADKETLSAGLARNAVAGVAYGKGSVVGHAAKKLAKSKIGVMAANSGVGKAAGNLAEGFVKGDAALLSSQIFTNIDDFAKMLKKVPILKGLGGSIDNIAAELAETVGKKMASAGAKLASAAGKAIPLLNAAFVIADFTTGFEDAATTLKVKEANTGEKIVCGLLRAVKNCIPIVGSLIPDSVLTDIFVKYIFPAMGLNMEDFNKRRDEAQAELDAYNAENGTNMSWSEYNKSVRGDYTWTERIGNAAKTTWTQTKAKFSNMKDGIKEKGLGGYMKDSVTKMGSDFMAGYKESGGGLAGMFSGIGKTFGNMLPGVFGDIAKANMEIKSLALKGNIKDMWAMELPDFGGKSEDEGDVEKAVPGMFSRIIGQLPLLMNKLKMTPVALLTAAFNGMKNKAADLFSMDDIKSNYNAFKNACEQMKNTANKDNVKISDIGTILTNKLTLPKKTALDKLFKYGHGYAAIFNAMTLIVKSITGKLEPLIDKVKFIKDKVDRFKLFGDNSDDTPNTETSGGGSGFVNQLDPRYRGISVGGKSFAANGCGPAAAVMASGGNLGAATNLAQYYQTPAGTDASFFDAYARRNGGRASYAVGSNNVARAIYGGSGTILLGQDPTNRSKSTSPFGPNGHYVSVDGVTRNGGLVISDPEQKGKRVYSRNAAKRIIGSSKLAIRMSGSGTTIDDYKYQTRASGINYGTDNRFNLGSSYTTSSKATAQQIALSDLGSFSPVTAEQMNQWIASKRSDSPFVGHGDIFIEASRQSGLDPRYILAHAAVESAWGTSNMARTKHNYFGIAAYDSNPGAAYTMGDGLDGIIAGAKWIAEHYYNRGQKSVYRMRYNGGTNQYCTSDTWVNSIALIMKNGPENTKIKVIDKEDPSINAFTGGAIVPTGTINAGSSKTVSGINYANDNRFTSSGTSSSGSNNSTSSGNSIVDAYKSGGLLGGIQAVLSNAFGKVFGGANESSSDQNSAESDLSQEGQTTGMINTGKSSALLRSGNSSTGDRINNFPYYNQTEEPWQGESYGSSGTIKSSGCGPTSMAMVLKSYGENVTPSDTAKWSADNGYRVVGTGTSWGYFNAIGNEAGLTTSQYSDPNTAKESLNSNIPVIASMGPGDFTNKGHFVVLSGLKDKELLVNDPSSRDRSAKVWDVDGALSQAKQFWSISKNGVGSLNMSDSTLPAIDYANDPKFKAQSAPNLRENGYSSSMDGMIKNTPSNKVVSSKQVTASNGESITVEHAQGTVYKYTDPYTGSDYWTDGVIDPNTGYPRCLTAEQKAALERSGSGSGLGVVSYSDFVKRRSGGSSGVLLDSRVGSSVYGSNPTGVYVPKTRRANFIGERGKTIYKNQRVQYSGYAGGASGIDMNNEQVVKLLQGIYNYMANIDANTGEGGWIQNSIDGTTNAMSNAVKGIANTASKASSIPANQPDEFGNIALEGLSKQLRDAAIG